MVFYNSTFEEEEEEEEEEETLGETTHQYTVQVNCTHLKKTFLIWKESKTLCAFVKFCALT